MSILGVVGPGARLDQSSCSVEYLKIKWLIEKIFTTQETTFMHSYGAKKRNTETGKPYFTSGRIFKGLICDFNDICLQFYDSTIIIFLIMLF